MPSWQCCLSTFGLLKLIASDFILYSHAFHSAPSQNLFPLFLSIFTILFFSAIPACNLLKSLLCLPAIISAHPAIFPISSLLFLTLKPYTCDGCKELGFGPRYRCKKCNFDLHKACMFSHKAPNSHEFFPGSTFEFLRNPPEPCHEECRIKCDACTRTINGFVFHCDKPDLDLHPCCLNLKKSYQIEDVEFNLHKKVKGKCMWCKRKSLKDGGWSYISECGEYHVHVACVTEMALEEWYKNGGNIAEHEQSLALKMNLNQIQARGHGNGRRGNKFWRILKIFIQTIVSIVLGDPTMILTSFFVQLIA